MRGTLREAVEEYDHSIKLIRQSMDEFGRGQDISADIVFAELREKLDFDLG